MATQQSGRQLGGRFAVDGRGFGLVLAFVVLASVLVATLIWRPRTAPLRTEQPVIGQAMTVTAQVWDGVTYRNVPVQVSARPRVIQPVIGQAMTVTALVWDGTAYWTMPVRVSDQYSEGQNG